MVVLMSKYEVVNGGGGSDACMYVHAQREGRRVLVGGLQGTVIDCQRRSEYLEGFPLV